MNYEQKLLWIIPNDQYMDKELPDGKAQFFPKLAMNGDHREECREFCENIGLTDCPKGGSHDDLGNYLSKKGFAAFFNSGVPVDGKYFGVWYLPEQLSMKQIEFLESQEALFREKYHTHPSFFNASIQSSEPLSYRSNNNLRNLTIEAMISNKPSDNGIDLLYQEIACQKEKLLNNQK